MPLGFQDYYLPETTDEDFGIAWPRGLGGQSVSQVVKDLAGFRFNGQRNGFLSRYDHGLRLVQMIFPSVRLYEKVIDWRTGREVVIWNHYFLDCFRDCCEHNRVGLTGCSSSGKTFAVAVYCLLLFMCDPSQTMIMISTTAGSDSERRVWGEIKDLWREAQNTFPLGTLIDYLKAITFDPSREFTKAKRSAEDRDLRNGIIVIPIPRGAEGENALGKIIGTKNRTVVWVIDEMPHMVDSVLRPESNLESNIIYQFIGIGNANVPTDPHGKLCLDGVDMETVSVDSEEWIAGDCHVRFFHGGRSPNFHPAVNPNIERKEDFPFPYLSNRIFMENVAFRNGNGQTREERIASGMRTVDYMRFCIGFWYGDDTPVTIMSRELVVQNGANRTDAYFDHRGTVNCAGFDPAFTAGGDSNEIAFGSFGHDMTGQQILRVEPETVTIRITAQDRVAFRTEISTRVIEECEKRDVEPNRLFMDISGDGGLMALEISRVWSQKLGRHVAPTGISSLEKTGDEDDAWHDIVTKLWFQCALAIGSGRMRGFNVLSGYAKDLFERRYESVGKGIVKIESKSSRTGGRRGMKARIGRSPDCFVAGTMVLTINGEVPIELIREGELIATPFGYSPVVVFHRTMADSITSVEMSNGRTISGKGAHRVYTRDSGWVRLDSISLTNEIESVRGIPSWKILNSLFTRKENTGFKQLADTTRTGTRRRRRDLFIESSGLSGMGLFLRGIRSITSMATGLITRRITSNACQPQSIHRFTCRTGWRPIMGLASNANSSHSQERPQRSGTDQMMEGSGTVSMPPTRFGGSASSGPSNVSSAERNSQLSIGEQRKCAPGHVGKSGLGQRIERTASALYVATRSILSSILRLPIAPVRALRSQQHERSEETYNLTLLEENAYYANGILVENCGDAFVYMIEGVKREGFELRVTATETPPPTRSIQDIMDRLRPQSTEEEADWLSYEEAAELELEEAS